MNVCWSITLLLLVASVFQAVPADASESSGGYIYDLVAPGTNLSIVINVAGDMAGIQNRRDANPSTELGEFSGPIRDCSDAIFLCIDGPLLIRVPRDPRLTEWRYQGVSCLARPLRAGVLQYRCHTVIYGRRVDSTYDYSSSRGVISFGGMPLWAHGRFRLRGRQGIFSNGPLGGA